jgi:hypothetical protein
MLLGILHFVDDFDQVLQTMAQLLDAVPSGSYLALTHATLDIGSQAAVEANAEAQKNWNENAAVLITARSREQVLRVFDGQELQDRGLVLASVIGVALAAKAAGAGARSIAAGLGVASATVRGRLRRFAGRAEAVRSLFTALAVFPRAQAASSAVVMNPSTGAGVLMCCFRCSRCCGGLIC